MLFRSDPNRVLDLVLEAFENDADNETFTTLIGYFNNQALPQIIGFKLAPENESSKEISHTIFKIAAQLLKAECFDLSNIWDYLSPEDEEMMNSFERRLEIARSLCLNANILKLDSGQSHQKDKEREHKELEGVKK